MVAYQAYHYLFKNKDLTITTVLGGFDQATASKIYSNEVIGMDSVNKLSYWISALYNKKGSPQYKLVEDMLKAQ